MKIFSKFVKILFLLVCIPLSLTGCDQDNSSGDVVKIGPGSTGHEMVKDYYSMDQDNLLNLGKINLQAGEVDDAIQILEKFTQYYPNNPVGQFYLGKAYYKKGEYKDSIRKFKKAFIFDKTSPEPLLHLGMAYKQTGEQDKAINAVYEYLLRETDITVSARVEDKVNTFAEPVVGKNIIGRVFVSDDVIKEENIALNPKIFFRADTPEIFASVEIIGSANDTPIRIKWYYFASEEEKIEVNSSAFKAGGTQNVLIALKKPSTDWPAGKYKLEILVENEKNAGLIFYIF